jgi:hypothetical protein
MSELRLGASASDQVGDSVEFAECGRCRSLPREEGNESQRSDQGSSRRACPAEASAQEVGNRIKGLPPLTIKDVKVITTSAGRNYRWVFLKVITSEPGLYGIGSANDNYQTQAVISALEKHLKPWVIGKDPDRVEDLWQSAHFKTYWRNGPVNKVLGALDEALWDIKGKRAGMAVFEMLGGKGARRGRLLRPRRRTRQGAGRRERRQVDGERLPPHPRPIRRGLRRQRLYSRQRGQPFAGGEAGLGLILGFADREGSRGSVNLADEVGPSGSANGNRMG